MQKILILSNIDIGLYKFRKELIQELVKKYDVYVSTPYGEFVPNLQDLGCTHIDVDMERRGTNPINELKLLLKYIKLIGEIKPNIVLTYTIKPNVYGGIACRIKRTPYIVNITGLGSAVENKGLLKNIALFLYKLALKNVSCTFFQNTENLQLFVNRKIVRDKYRLIPGSGVNLNEYQLIDYPPEQNIEFVFISRILKEKGIDQYLDAAEFIRKKYPNTKFHICGFCEDDYEEKLNKFQDDGIIEYHGMVHDIKKIYERVHCTIHPTYYPEGMSNVLLESAACGRPIITTDRSGCKEIVDDGINGFIVDQQNSQDLISKIEKFLGLSYEDKKNMGLAGRRKVESQFSRHIIVEAYNYEICKVLKNYGD